MIECILEFPPYRYRAEINTVLNIEGYHNFDDIIIHITLSIITKTLSSMIISSYKEIYRSYSIQWFFPPTQPQKLGSLFPKLEAKKYPDQSFSNY